MEYFEICDSGFNLLSPTFRRQCEEESHFKLIRESRCVEAPEAVTWFDIY